MNKLEFLVCLRLDGSEFHSWAPRKARAFLPNSVATLGGWRLLEEADLVLWWWTDTAGLKRVDRLSGLSPEIQRKVTIASLSLLLDASVGQPSCIEWNHHTRQWSLPYTHCCIIFALVVFSFQPLVWILHLYSENMHCVVVIYACGDGGCNWQVVMVLCMAVSW